MTWDPIDHPRGNRGRFVDRMNVRPAGGLALPPLPDVQRSRSVLVRVLRGLEDIQDAFTVIGAHAVMERTVELETMVRNDSTRDADLGMNPQLIASTDELVSDRLVGMGLTRMREGTPGVWGLFEERNYMTEARLTIDIIAPAGVDRSALDAREAPLAMTTPGTELALLDRSVLALRDFATGDTIPAYVAGHAALLCAKFAKLNDRIDDAESGRDGRLRGKDAADVWRLIATSDPLDVRRVFDAGTAHSVIGQAVRDGKAIIERRAERVARIAGEHLELQFGVDADETSQMMLDWIDEFRR